MKISLETIRIKNLSSLNDAKICYWKEFDESANREVWKIYFPSVGVGNLRNHTVDEHADGTISVSPSILVEGHTGKIIHGFLERGIWRDT